MIEAHRVQNEGDCPCLGWMCLIGSRSRLRLVRANTVSKVYVKTFFSSETGKVFTLSVSVAKILVVNGARQAMNVYGTLVNITLLTLVQAAL